MKIAVYLKDGTKEWWKQFIANTRKENEPQQLQPVTEQDDNLKIYVVTCVLIKGPIFDFVTNDVLMDVDRQLRQAITTEETHSECCISQVFARKH